MRDKKRIKRILKKLTTCWLLCPDMRLGQLICNVGLNDFNIEDERDPKWVSAHNKVAEEELDKWYKMVKK